jgi:hypothetical protein
MKTHIRVVRGKFAREKLLTAKGPPGRKVSLPETDSVQNRNASRQSMEWAHRLHTNPLPSLYEFLTNLSLPYF